MNDLERLSAEAVDACSLVYLIDEDLCLGNSYDVMNTNFDSLSASQDNLSHYSDPWHELRTVFSANSAKWLSALENITTLSAQWESAYATKELYKKYWDVPIFIVYPKFINFNEYYNDITTHNNVLKTWLNINFPVSQYIMDQVVDLTINLCIIKHFPYTFSRTMVENCTPATGNSQNTICCQGCGTGNAGLCNYYEGGHSHGGSHGRVIRCFPVCQGCTIYRASNCASYTCYTLSPPQTLTLSYSTNFEDQYINRVISLRFKNNKTEWIQL